MRAPNRRPNSSQERQPLWYRSSAMKSRRAAVLALLGWYLLIPPLRHSGFDDSAPLSKWWTYKNFDTAADCTNGFRRNEPPGREVRVRDHGGKDTSYRNRCIASDDPRLAK